MVSLQTVMLLVQESVRITLGHCQLDCFNIVHSIHLLSNVLDSALLVNIHSKCGVQAALMVLRLLLFCVDQEDVHDFIIYVLIKIETEIV